MTLNDWLRSEKLVQDLAWKHCRKYGGDWNEVYSEAMFLFVTASLSHDGLSCKLSTWISLKVSRGLQDWRMRERGERRKLQRVPMPADVEERRTSFSLLDWIDELTHDARSVVAAILESPDEVLWAADAPRVQLRTIRTLLLERGWTPEQVQGAFDEVRMSL